MENNNSDETKKFILNKYDDVQKIANHILNGSEAIVDLSNLEKGTAIRTTDFLSGLIYAIEGKVRKLEDKVYHFYPKSE